jgi:hypothetical protein
MPATRPKQTRLPRKRQGAAVKGFPAVLCPRCGSQIVTGEQVVPVVALLLAKPDEHPVLSKPVTLRGMISADGSARTDLSIGAQLRQRAAMGGAKERAELAAFEALLVKAIASALVEELRREDAGHVNGVAQEKP